MPEEPVLDADDFSAAVSAVTSAFGDPTRRDIYLAIRETPAGVTATEVAERFALHPNVARHHLEKLSAGGSLMQCGWLKDKFGLTWPWESLHVEALAWFYVAAVKDQSFPDHELHTY